MSLQAVDIYVVDNTGAHRPVAGMVVRIYDSSNVHFLTQENTDAAGHAGFTLDTGDYNLRFFKFGAQVSQPLRIVVLEPTSVFLTPNEFEVYATIFVHPTATDARLCRASGYFRDITGAAHPYLDIHFIGQFDPILLEGAAVVSERRSIRTDKDGFACIDLIRGACYTAMLEGFEDVERQVLVPDAPSTNLPDVLFPVVREIAFDVLSPVVLTVGGTVDVTPTVLTSSGVPLPGTATSDVLWSSSDESIFSVNSDGTVLTLRGLASGSAGLLAERLNKTIIQVPDVGIVGVPLAVNVV